jgi:hypothetical protein
MGTSDEGARVDGSQKSLRPRLDVLILTSRLDRDDAEDRGRGRLFP